MNMFYHPIYISNYPACRIAIEEGLRYLRERKITALHMGNDELYRWWKARSDTRLGDTLVEGNSLSFEVESSYAAGSIVNIPLGRQTATSVSINSTHVSTGFKNEQIFGQNWALIAVPSGNAQVRLLLA